MKYFTAVDPGMFTSNMGLATFEDGKLTWSRSISFKKHKTFSEKVDSEEFYEFLVTLGGYTVVEESFYQGIANKYHQRLLGIIQYTSNVMETIAPLSVKKLVTGSGKATKYKMKVAVKKQLSKAEQKLVDFKDEDAVDAVAIGLAYMKREKES